MLYKEYSLICRYYAYKDGIVFQRIEFEMQCLLFYYTAWTFLESGAVVTDRATAERRKNEYRGSRIQYRFLSCWL